MATYDRSSKWLIEHHGDSILRLAGFGPVKSWRALQAEVIQPGQLPDGLIGATLIGDIEPRLFIIELATYPGKARRRTALPRRSGNTLQSGSTSRANRYRPLPKGSVAHNISGGPCYANRQRRLA